MVVCLWQRSKLHPCTYARPISEAPLRYLILYGPRAGRALARREFQDLSEAEFSET